jgi:hypothetical protein
MSAAQESNFIWWRGAFYPVSFKLAVRRYRPEFGFWPSVIAERKENKTLTTRVFQRYQGNGHDV